MRNLLVLGFIAAVSAAPAFAQEVTISGNVGLTTDYAFRGISQSDESPAIQGGLDASFGDSGFYLGTWASSINFGTGGANMELDVYGGYKFALGGVNMDVGVLGYLYPSASDDGAELDFWELYAKPSIALTDQFTLGAAFAYSPEFTGETGDAFYYEVNGAFAATPELSFSGAVGVQTVDTDGLFAGEDSYTTWNVGGTYSALGLGFDLRYHGTDVDNAPIYDDRVIFSIKKAL
ncbi:MAG TPA: TorF family putative porin [Hyphomonadaceae bacterium]|nr:TorF family putative porin [Hyphomonadaceae bacterium]HPN04830.1 TorF family putative porin [Hyphomonadaceae bacterium]